MSGSGFYCLISTRASLRKSAVFGQLCLWIGLLSHVWNDRDKAKLKDDMKTWWCGVPFPPVPLSLLIMILFFAGYLLWHFHRCTCTFHNGSYQTGFQICRSKFNYSLWNCRPPLSSPLFIPSKSSRLVHRTWREVPRQWDVTDCRHGMHIRVSKLTNLSS